MARSSIKQRIAQEDGRLFNVWEQPDRPAILASNREKAKGNPRKSDWIKPLCAIPELDRELLRQRKPEIFEDSRKMERFINSSSGRPYRTTPRGRSRNFSFGGI